MLSRSSASPLSPLPPLVVSGFIALILHLSLPSGPITAEGLIDEAHARIAGSFSSGDVFGARFFFTANEREEGVDLNGDGDSSDSLVAHMFNARDRSLRNFALALAELDRIEVADGIAVFNVDEGDQGEDLNSDGDMQDVISHLYDIERDQLLNLEFAALRQQTLQIGQMLQIKSANGLFVYDRFQGDLAEVPIKGKVLAHRGRTLLLSRTEQRDPPILDYNGDGDGFDGVVHIYNLNTGVLVNLGIAQDKGEGGGTLSDVEFDQDLCAFTVREARQGHTDLNGDLDFADNVLHIYDFRNGTVTNTQLAVTDPGNPGIYRVQVGMGRIFFSALEEDQGQTDLNGDGDALDEVLHVFDSSTATISSLNLALSDHPTASNRFELKESLLSFAVSEFDQGFTDLNQDNDVFDRVAHTYDVLTGTTTNLEIAGNILNLGNFLAIIADETEQGLTDLNNDGDFLDLVPIVMDPALGPSSMNLLPIGLDPEQTAPRGEGSTLVFRVNEQSFGNQDLNGDGLINGNVPFLYDAESGELTNLGFTTSWAVQIKDRRLSYVIFNDRFLFDSRTGISFNTEGSSQRGSFVGSFLYVYTIKEENVSEDRNGDGDQLDVVVHIVVLDRPFGAGSVNEGAGPVTDILTVDGKTGTVSVQVGSPLQVTLDAPPLNLDARYLLWVWPDRPTQETEVRGPSGDLVGRLVNALPFGPGLDPRPMACIRSDDFLPGGCSRSDRMIIGPRRAPWTIIDPGFAAPIDLTIQGIIEDNGSASSDGFSVTNAIILQARD